LETNIFIEIPTYELGEWTVTTFYTREEFRDFVSGIFKEPGQYNFTESSLIFNAEARKFQKQGYYCTAPIKTKDFIHYWDDQKAKCRNGIIVKDAVDTWYISRDYYMWLNFLPIYDKEEKLPRSKIIEIMMQAKETVMTVQFCKKIDDAYI
jgi:hypothetical protein